MKKLVTMGLLILSSLSVSFGQGLKFTGGIYTGLFQSSVDQTDGHKSDLRLDTTNTKGQPFWVPLNNSKVSGLTLGLSGNIYINERIKLGVDVSYARVGNLAIEAQSNEKYVINRENKKIKVVGFDQYKDNAKSIQTALTVQVQPFRSYRWGVMLGGGFSVNKYFNGREVKSVKTQDQEIINSDREVTFGKGKTNDYAGTDVSVIINPSLFINLDSDGAIRLVADARWSIGTQDMFTNERKEFLNSSPDHLQILGKQAWRQASFRLGVEFCLNCRR